ncbi:MAG TPA: helix-turn-helix domain-containing protein [Humibacter sp.]|nr:helix-turn-helix domain-containing protein [Humibacter sp.]
MTTPAVQIAAALRTARERAGLSQILAADRAGLHPTTLAKLEAGTIPNPTLSTLLAAAAGVGVSVAQLVDGIEPQPRPDRCLTARNLRPEHVVATIAVKQ